MNKKNTKKAFTLIEILFVIVIIGVLASVIIISLTQSAREKARIAQGQQYADSLMAKMEIGIYGNNTAGAGWDLETINGSSPPYTIDASLSSTVGILGNGSCSPGSGNCPSPVDGIRGKALSFDGNDYVNFGNSLQIADKGTVALWAKIEAWPSGSRSTLIGKHNWSWHIGINSSAKKLAFTRWGPWQYFDSTSTLELDKWYYFVFTIESDISSNNAKLYIDGNLEKERNMDTPLRTNGNLMLSKYVQSDIDWHTGCIDEVSFSEETLTAQQIQQRYAESAPRHGIALK